MKRIWIGLALMTAAACADSETSLVGPTAVQTSAPVVASEPAPPARVTCATVEAKVLEYLEVCQRDIPLCVYLKKVPTMRDIEGMRVYVVDTGTSPYYRISPVSGACEGPKDPQVWGR